MNAEIKRNSNNFSFIETAGNAVTNQQFNSGRTSLANGQTTDMTYLWVALSAASQDIGETIYENVLNYIDLASNVDLCKISALKSMFAQQGIGYRIFDNMQNVPLEIQNMLDVLSINKKYLIDSKVLDGNLLNEIKQYTTTSVDVDMSSYVQVEYRTVANTISVDAYDLQSSNFIPAPDIMLGEYVLQENYAYDYKYDIGTQDQPNGKHTVISTYVDDYYGIKQFKNAIHVYKQYINKNSIEVSIDGDETLSSYYVIRKFIYADEFDAGKTTCSYGIFKDVDSYENGKNTKLSASLVAYLGDLETTVNKKNGYEVDIKTAFDYRHNFRNADYDKYQFDTLFLGRNLYRNLYVRVNPAFELTYQNSYIDDEKWKQWLTDRYYQLLSGMCYMHYLSNGVENANDNNTAIYNVIRDELTSTTDLSINTDLSSNSRLKKLLHNVEYTFNEKEIADNIEAGTDDIDNYIGVKKELIEAELTLRKQALSGNYNDWTTRTSYYRTEKVRQYFKFIQDTIFYSTQKISDLNYKLDPQYFEISQQNSYKRLLSDIDDTPDLEMIQFVARKLAQITIYISEIRESIKIQAQKNYMKGTFNLLSYMINEYLYQLGKSSSIFSNIESLQTMCKVSCEISSDISNIFEHGYYSINGKKIQEKNILLSSVTALSNGLSSLAISAAPAVDIALQNYMLSSVDDYKNAIKSNKITYEKILANYNTAYSYLKDIKNKLSTHLYEDVGIIEYDDITEYYNIQTDTSDKSKYKSNLNNQFWNESFNINTNTNFAFSDSEISSFYCNNLNISPDINTTDEFDNFLSFIFSTGASKAYIGDDDVLVINCEKETTEDGQTILKDIEAHTQMFLKFNGQDLAYSPYHNIKNKTHSSYQIHPYLYNFVKASNIISPLKNGFMGIIAKAAIEDRALSQINTNIGKFGNIINVWKNNSYDYSGYMSRWEASSHSTSTGTLKTCPVVDYEGIFYPPAIADFLELSGFSISTLIYPNAQTNADLSNYGINASSLLKNKSIKLSDETFYHKYYDHLNLSKIDREKIINQLSTYANELKSISLKATDVNKLYDIYKYGTDMYGNNYILLKDYTQVIESLSGEELTFADKENTPGKLYIRLKDNPIAFPAFSNKKYQVVNTEIMNGSLSAVLGNNTSRKDVFYDMEFDTSKRMLLLNAYQGNITGYNDEISSLLSTDGYDRKEQSLLLLCSIEMSSYNKTNETKLILNHNNKNDSKYDSISSLYNINCIDAEDRNVISYLGCMKTDTTVSPTYIVKGINKFEPYLPNRCLSILMAEYNPRTGIFSKLSGQIDLDKYSQTRIYSYGNDLKMSYTGNIMTLAMLATISAFNATTYFGKIDSTTSNISSAVYVPDDSYTVNETDKSTFDSFEQNIVLLDIAKTNNSLVIDGNPQIYNLNADASYLPLYPNETGKLNVYKSAIFKNQKYQLFQLLGREADIDAKIAATNPNADFNFDQAQLTANLSGRVYEDAAFDEIHKLLDKTLHITTNSDVIRLQTLPTIRFERKTWAILNLEVPYIDDVEHTYCVFANKNTTAKNMYFAGKAETLSSSLDNTINNTQVVNYNSTSDIHEHQILTDEADVKVTGTYNFYDQKLNVSDTNNIPNVSNIRISLTNKNRLENKATLNIFFELVSEKTPSYVDRDVFQFIAYNSHVLKVYEWCHMLDEAGIYKIKDGKHYLLDYDRTGRIIKRTQLTGELSNGLSCINFDDYETLDDIPSLSGYVKNLSFKLDESIIFNIDESNFYFPGYNKNFPTFIGNILSANATANDTEGLFSAKNYFIFKVDDPKDIANSIGKVDIPIGKYDNYCLRVYEDYDPTKYSNNDIQNVEYVKFSIDDNYYNQVFNIAEDEQGNPIGIDFDKFYIIPGANIDFDLYRFQQYGLLHTTTEALKKDHTMDFVRVDISEKNVDLDNLLDIYVNYKFDANNKIILYFNYYNYINSPFVEFKDTGKLKLYTVPRTYLKLKTGESGLLDIDVQFNVYQGKELRGTKLGTVLTYRIYNISDDKPKFVIQKVRQIKKDSLIASTSLLETYIIVKDMFIDLNDDDIQETDEIQFNQEIIVNSTKEIVPGMTFYLYYNINELEYQAGMPHSASIEVEEIIDESTEKQGNQTVTVREKTGILKITTIAYMSNTVLYVPFKTILPKRTIVANEIYEYGIDISDVNGNTVEKVAIDPILSPGGVTFGYEINLGLEQQKSDIDRDDLVLLEDGRRILVKDRQFEK